MNKIICGTGHRCNKLPNKETGYDLTNPTYQYIRKEVIKLLEQIQPEKIISGMALGYDTLLAIIAIELNIPFIQSTVSVCSLKEVAKRSKRPIWFQLYQGRFPLVSGHPLFGFSLHQSGL